MVPKRRSPSDIAPSFSNASLRFGRIRRSSRRPDKTRAIAGLVWLISSRHAFQRAFQTHSRFAAHHQQIDRIRRAKPNGGIKTPLQHQQDQSRPHNPDHHANKREDQHVAGGLPESCATRNGNDREQEHADNLDTDPDRQGSVMIETSRLKDRPQLLQILLSVKAPIPHADRRKPADQVLGAGRPVRNAQHRVRHPRVQRTKCISRMINRKAAVAAAMAKATRLRPAVIASSPF